MPYCQETFLIVKKTDKYKQKMRKLNIKSYHKMKDERFEDYANALVRKQAKYLIKTREPHELEACLLKVSEKHGFLRSQNLENVLKSWGFLNEAMIPVESVAKSTITLDT